ncbi:unnamed protein product [Gadus morhua 'NCC']
MYVCVCVPNMWNPRVHNMAVMRDASARTLKYHHHGDQPITADCNGVRHGVKCPRSVSTERTKRDRSTHHHGNRQHSASTRQDGKQIPGPDGAFPCLSARPFRDIAPTYRLLFPAPLTPDRRPGKENTRRQRWSLGSQGAPLPLSVASESVLTRVASVVGSGPPGSVLLHQEEESSEPGEGLWSLGTSDGSEPKHWSRAEQGIPCMLAQ